MTERRTFGLEVVSVREAAGGRLVHFRGHAAVFKQRAWIGDPKLGFWEEVTPTAFDRALAEDDVRFLLDHDPATVMARTASGTLRLSKDRTGLVAEADLDPTDPDVTRLIPKLTRGDLNQMSFAFVAREGGTTEEQQKDGTWLRRLTDVQLYDVSVVAYPAYEGTEAALRAVEARRADVRRQTYTALRRRLDDAWKGSGT